MNKKTLLFDTDVLCLGISKGNTSGIFCVSLNILKELIKDNHLQVYLSSPPLRKKKSLKEFLKKELGQDVIFYPPLTPRECKIGDIYEKIKFFKERKQYLKKFLSVIYLGILKKLNSFRKSYDLDKVFDLYLSSFFSPKSFKVKKKFLFLYDATPYLYPTYFDSSILRAFNDIVSSFNKDDYYFSISENTKADFLRYFPVLTDKQIKVTPLAASESFYHETDKQRLMAVREKYNIPTNKKYVFSLCTLEPRKNLIRAVKTFVQFIEKNKITDLIFVLGGGHWDTFLTKLEGEIKYIPDGLIKKVGYVDDADLATLYSGAEWFVYTSQYEGFGLPPLEAMQCGCPVITSNNSSLPEVVGDAGIMIDWDSDEQHIKAYEEYYFNKDLRDANAAKSMERAKEFSWQKTANLMIKEMMK